MPARAPLSNRLIGIGLRLGAATCFALMATMIKLGHESGIALAELAFYRFAFGLPPLLAWMVLTSNLTAWRTRRPGAHLFRGALGLVNLVLGFSALAYLPLAEATTISFVAPLLAVMLSALVLNEKVGRYRWTAVAVGFAGVILVVQPSGGTLPLIGVTLAFFAALGVAGVTIAIRELGRTESTPTMVLWFSFFSILASSAFMPFFAESHDRWEWTILLILGLAEGLGQLFLTSSLRYAPVAVIAPFDYVQLLWAVLLGWLVWDTLPQAASWAGAAIIIASGLVTVWREHRLGRDKPRPEPL